MDAHRIVSAYERIAGLMAHMVEAARAREWDRLERLQSSCKEFIETLQAANLDVPMSAPLSARRTRLIGQVLRADAQIRNLTEPWTVQLHAWLGVGHNEVLKRAAHPLHTRPQRHRTK
jgi:flagellar protein FliT